MTRVIDASVACKWFFDEQGSEEARKLLTNGLVIAPDLIVAEVTNVAWRRVIQAEVEIDHATAAVAGLISVMDQLVSAAPLGEPALAIAHALNHPAYDCFYVALAEDREAVLVTGDRALLRRVAQTRWQVFVKPLLH